MRRGPAGGAALEQGSQAAGSEAPREKRHLRILAPQVYLIMELLRSGKLLAAVLTIFSQDMDSKAARQVILPRRYLLVELLTSGELLGRCWRWPC